jgi:feruloyl esterase
LKKVYGGPRDSRGRQLFPGQPFSAEAIYRMPPGGDLQSGWQAMIRGGAGAGFMKFAFDPPAEPDWDFHTFNFDTDPARLATMALRLDATVTDMSAVRERGGKILHYTGWADPMVPASMSINYYEATRKNMGEKETDDFYRLFLVPGMGHCTGGPGCSSVDWLTPVVNWVEKGTAPTMLLGSHIEGGRTTRTRPICAYPSTAQYKGSGSIDEADNFICAR